MTGSFWKAFVLGLQMIALVFRYRLGFYARERALWTQDVHSARPPATQSLAALAMAVEHSREQKPEPVAPVTSAGTSR